MSVVILGGNECMERRYKEICQAHRCDVKVFAKPVCNLKQKIGTPDLLICFTGTISHKMVKGIVSTLNEPETIIERSHSSSVAALKTILQKHAG